MSEHEASDMSTALGEISPVEELASDSKDTSKFWSVTTTEAAHFARFYQHKQRSCSLILLL